MTREQKIAKAKKLRAEGLTYRELGERFGVDPRTPYRWLNPGYAERKRKADRDWKARNREALRAYDREYNKTHKGECSSCGGETTRQSDGGICMPCREDEVDRRARQIERWWAEGASLKEIQARLGWTRGHLSQEFDRLREKGYKLPYRYKNGKRRGRRFPDQAPA